jgi:hypothetical protein
LRIFIIHYHLQPGGVTRVIESQVQSLSSGKTAGAVTILTGDRPIKLLPGLASAEVQLFPYLSYLNPDLANASYRKIHQRLGAFLRQTVSPEDIIHIHNLGLGKNPVLSVVMGEMVQEGYRVFIHCHDFAENHRFRNYDFIRRVITQVFQRPAAKTMYPVSPRVLYGTVNTRDRQFLIQAGIPRKQVGLLPNPAGEGPAHRTSGTAMPRLRRLLGWPDKRPFYFYPVRGIRRKNLGEFVLLSALFPQVRWVLSLAPHDPEERPQYDQWVRFSRENSLPVYFAAGERAEYYELMQAAEKIITTSVTEGFGLAFLEPWLFGKAVAGRDLPAITRDFKAAGMQFSALYRRVSVPRALAGDLKHIRALYREYINDAGTLTGFSETAKLCLQVERAKFAGATVDFADLPVPMQQNIIRQAADNVRFRQTLIRHNHLERVCRPESAAAIGHNRGIVRKQYSLTKYRKKLSGIYRALAVAKASSKKTKTIKERSILGRFLVPDGFRMIQR